MGEDEVSEEPESISFKYAQVEDAGPYRSTLEIVDAVVGMVNDILKARKIPLRIRIEPHMLAGEFEVNWFAE